MLERLVSQHRSAMDQMIETFLELRGIAVYAVVGLLAFGEAAAFIGLFLPGEMAVLLGGVLASQGRVSLPVMIAVAALAAIAGDSAGYEIGRRWGVRLLELPLMHRHAGAVAEASDYLRRRGGMVIFVGRWTSVLRALVPFVAGMSHMPYGRFLVYNVLGGVAWASAFTTLGFLAGASFRQVESMIGRGSWVLGLLVIAALVGRWGIARSRSRRHADRAAS